MASRTLVDRTALGKRFKTSETSISRTHSARQWERIANMATNPNGIRLTDTIKTAIASAAPRDDVAITFAGHLRMNWLQAQEKFLGFNELYTDGRVY